MRRPEVSTGVFRAPDGAPLHEILVRPPRPARAVVLLVHGFGEHTGSFAESFAELAGADRALAGFDERGHGRSPGQRGHVASWDVYRQDLVAHARQLRRERPGQPVFAVGNSLGAIRVLSLALAVPELLAGIVLCGAPLAEVGASPLAMAAARLLSRLLPRFPIAPGLDLANISRDAARTAAYVGDGLFHQRASARGGAAALAAIRDVRSRAAELRVPLLMLHGSDDRIACPDESFFRAAGAADKARRVYAGARHNLFQETNRAELLADLAAWIEARTPGAGSSGG